MKQYLYSFSAGLLLGLTLIQNASAQSSLTLPRESPRTELKHRIGISDITLVYHSPAVKGRAIWGSLVPYKQVWRAGANENTSISFTHEVKIAGQSLAAGTYGLHMIPGETEWTLILSKNASSWGSYFYKKEEDALRATIKAQAHEHTEWLSYQIVANTANSATIALLWDKLMIPFTIEADVKNIVLASLRDELRSTPGFSWEGWYNAASYCLENDFNHEEALRWMERADRMKPNDFHVLMAKADLLSKNGKSSEADAMTKKALEYGTENDLNNYGYRLLGEGKKKEAIEIFRMNVKRNPASWNVYDSLGEALAANGDKQGAIKKYEIAMAKADDERKATIAAIISKLKN